MGNCEYGGNAIRVDDVGAGVADDMRQRPSRAYERGNRTKKGKKARGPVKADGRDWENGTIGHGISPCRSKCHRKDAARGEAGQKFIETRLRAAAS
jgi:hypothetical protein